MVDLRFTLEGQEVVSRRLGIAAAGVTDFKAPFAKIGSNFLKTFDTNFSARGGVYGRWQPRKPKYRNGIRIDTWPLLEKTGRMRRSFTQQTTRNRLVLGNSAPYFVYHQSNGPRTRLPRRVMMKLRQQEATMIVKEFQAFLIGVLRSAGER